MRKRARLVELTWLLRFSTSKGWRERKQVSAEGLPELPTAHTVIQGVSPPPGAQIEEGGPSMNIPSFLPSLYLPALPSFLFLG